MPVDFGMRALRTQPGGLWVNLDDLLLALSVLRHECPPATGAAEVFDALDGALTEWSDEFEPPPTCG